MAISEGVPLASIRDLLGHSSITVTERYAHLEPDAVREVVAALDQLQSHFGHTGRAVKATSDVLTLVKGKCRREDLVEPRRIELLTYAV